MVYIYALTDPKTGKIRYVGKSTQPMTRLRAHLLDASRTHRTHWLQGLAKESLKPSISILEKIPAKAGVDWRDRERWWIAHGRESGWPLTNCTSGGDGVPDLPPEIRERITQASRNRRPSDETRRKIGAASKGRIHSDDWRLLMKGKMTGRKITWIDKVARSMEKLTDDQVREIRQLMADKVSQYVIADKFGVHQGTISNIKRGVSYSHVK